MWVIVPVDYPFAAKACGTVSPTSVLHSNIYNREVSVHSKVKLLQVTKERETPIESPSSLPSLATKRQMEAVRCGLLTMATTNWIILECCSKPIPAHTDSGLEKCTERN